METDDQHDCVLEGELVDPEDIPLGETVWICRRLELAFDGRQDTLQTLILAAGIDSSEFVSAALVVILHEKSGWQSGSLLGIGAQPLSLDPLEPAVDFVDDVAATYVVIFESTQPPQVLADEIIELPGMYRVVATWSQGPREQEKAATATISVALVLRRHVPPRYMVLPRA